MTREKDRSKSNTPIADHLPEGRALWNLSLILRDIAASKKPESAPDSPRQEGDEDGRPKRARMGSKHRS